MNEHYNHTWLILHQPRRDLVLAGARLAAKDNGTTVRLFLYRSRHVASHQLHQRDCHAGHDKPFRFSNTFCFVSMSHPLFCLFFRPSSCSLAPTYLEGEIWLTSLGEDGVGDIELGL